MEGTGRSAEDRRSGAEVSVVAIVLAAGRATRMGEQKLLLPLAGRPVVRWAVDAALGSRAAETIAVVGHEAARVAEVLEGLPVTVVVNSHHEEGMSTSLQAGVRATEADRDAAIFVLGDQPFVTASLLDRLIERFAETRKAVVRPLVGGLPANPVLMSAELFPEILAQRGDVGGREIVARHPGEVCLVAVDDPRLGMDIDSVDDYKAARENA
ncbi:MAG TPA: nucleotidyltransferase family protein [Thermoleophilia bacterium]|nr:nucleotidyltransferase family protein [Thermoleophilia bacterium]